jgi:hypothetical protein
MDRNLGALEATLSPASRGLHYQWGRKDPFSVQDELIQFTAGPVSKEDAIKNPSTFYTTSETPYDWLSSPDDNLWNASGKKTIYDPCPAGFKIPRNGEEKDSPWAGLTPVFPDSDVNATFGDINKSYWASARFRLHTGLYIESVSGLDWMV